MFVVVFLFFFFYFFFNILFGFFFLIFFFHVIVGFFFIIFFIYFSFQIKMYNFITQKQKFIISIHVLQHINRIFSLVGGVGCLTVGVVCQVDN